MYDEFACFGSKEWGIFLVVLNLFWNLLVLLFCTIYDYLFVNDWGGRVLSYFLFWITACASNFPRYASDFGLIVPNGSYAITASHCVQCSCGPGNLKWFSNFAYILILLLLISILKKIKFSSLGLVLIHFIVYLCSLYCMPASLAVSCSSMQCRNSNLMLGNVTFQQSSAGCNVTACHYGGYVNGTIVTRYCYPL